MQSRKFSGPDFLEEQFFRKYLGFSRTFLGGGANSYQLGFPIGRQKNDFSLYAADVEAHANLVKCHVLAGTLI